MDGLTLCPPYGDAEYYVRRPTLAIQPPGSTDGAIDLDGFFGLAPAAAPLATPYLDGRLAIVHATGSTDPSRSHFDAMHFMETATPNMGTSSISTGWLGRHLALIPALGTHGFRGLTVGPLQARTVAGGPGTMPIPDPADFHFPGRPGTAAERRAVLEEIYARAHPTLKESAENAPYDLLASVDFAGYVPEHGAVYPATLFGTQLRNAMIKADIDLEVAHIDVGGWDLHNALGPVSGAMANLLDQLTRGIEAFYLDMLDHMDRVVLVAMSEFGRRIAENASLGADHGHGNCMLALGGGIDGGQVMTNWPGLTTTTQGDVIITIDYRDILAEILANRMGATDLATIFPSYTPTFQGITV